MSTKKEPTVEEAREVVEKHDEALHPHGVREEVDQSSGIRMKSQEPDKSVLTYDGSDPEYDEERRKQAAKERKEADKS